MEILVLFITLAAYGLGLAIIGATPLVLVSLIIMNYVSKKEAGENIF